MTKKKHNVMTEKTDNGIFTKEKITIMSLPVFRAVYNLSSLLIKVTNNFPKAFKHTLGSRILDASLDLSKILFSVNREEKKSIERLNEINKFLDTFDYLKVLIRLSEENKVISFKEAGKIAILMSSIGAQIGGWKKTTENKE